MSDRISRRLEAAAAGVEVAEQFPRETDVAVGRAPRRPPRTAAGARFHSEAWSLTARRRSARAERMRKRLLLRAGLPRFAVVLRTEIGERRVFKRPLPGLGQAQVVELQGFFRPSRIGSAHLPAAPGRGEPRAAAPASASRRSRRHGAGNPVAETVVDGIQAHLLVQVARGVEVTGQQAVLPAAGGLPAPAAVRRFFVQPCRRHQVDQLQPGGLCPGRAGPRRFAQRRLRPQVVHGRVAHKHPVLVVDGFVQAEVFPTTPCRPPPPAASGAAMRASRRSTECGVAGDGPVEGIKQAVRRTGCGRGGQHIPCTGEGKNTRRQREQQEKGLHYYFLSSGFHGIVSLQNPRYYATKLAILRQDGSDTTRSSRYGAKLNDTAQR